MIASWTITFSLCFFSLSGQTLDKQGHSLVEQIVSAAEEGQPRALRDLGTLLDRPEIQQNVQVKLEELLFVTPDEFQFTTGTDKTSFLAFYYNYEKRLVYSELLKAYFITPLEEHQVKYHSRENAHLDEHEQLLALREQKALFLKTLDSGDHSSLPGQVKRISQAPQGEGYRFLLEQLQNKQLQKSEIKDQLYATLCQSLGYYASQESFQAILSLLEKQLVSPARGAAALAQLSNIGLESYVDRQDVIQFYQMMYDSLSTISDMRHYGYRSKLSFQPEFFNHPVDYYGKVLNASREYPWLMLNATEDMIRTGHPRALFYLASQLYKYRDNGGKNPVVPDLSFEDLLKKLTRLDIGLEGKDSILSFQVENSYDTPLMKKFISYWSSHYMDYEWDEHHQYFTNKYKAEELAQNYERLFRRLNSQNDSVAQQSFIQLTLGDPVKIAELSDKYRNLLRSYNPSLPPLRYYYLEQLSRLTEFCRENRMPYEPGRTLKQKVKRLRSTISERERYALENELIRTMGLQDVTALEYLACIYEGNSDFSFSVGRILDWFYSEHWTEILENDQALLLYLKKSQLFSEIGVYGSCNAYLSKFNIKDPTLYSRLENISALTIDEGIINQMEQLLPMTEFTGETPGIEAFLKDPTNFHRNDIQILPTPTADQINTLFTQLKKEDDPEFIRQYLYFLQLHVSIEQTPYLFDLMQDERPIAIRERKIVPLGDYLVPLVEDIFQYQFPQETARQSWLAKWASDGNNYLDWRKKFLSERIEQLENEPEIDVKVLNNIITSPEFTDSHKAGILSLLKKIKPFRDIRKLQFEASLSLETDLPYFQVFSLSYKELDDIPGLFNIPVDKAPVMLTYLKEKSDRFTPGKKGAFYNNLFRAAWFTRYLNSLDQLDEHTQFIMETLTTYMEESEFLSEYQEQITYQHIASLEYLGLSLYEKLSASIQLQLDEGSKMKIQEAILAKVGYQDLGKIAPLIEHLSSAPGKSPYGFLQKDFGLPIFQLDEQGALETFMQQHDKLSEIEFYTYYLEAFGLDFRNKKGKLDFDKIYDMLHFDLVSPFVSRIGGQRDHYIYGLVKLLELHFETRLGFHEKLNENQTFYTFTSAKRAEAWIKYLRKNRLVTKDRSMPPSFSQLGPDN